MGSIVVESSHISESFSKVPTIVFPLGENPCLLQYGPSVPKPSYNTIPFSGQQSDPSRTLSPGVTDLSQKACIQRAPRGSYTDEDVACAETLLALSRSNTKLDESDPDERGQRNISSSGDWTRLAKLEARRARRTQQQKKRRLSKRQAKAAGTTYKPKRRSTQDREYTDREDRYIMRRQSHDGKKMSWGKFERDYNLQFPNRTRSHHSLRSQYYRLKRTGWRDKPSHICTCCGMFTCVQEKVFK